MIRLTPRQKDVLAYVDRAGCVRSGYDANILHALENKGLVTSYPWYEGQNKYYTWRVTDRGALTLGMLKGTRT